MLSQVKQIMDPTGRKEFAGRFGAWWDGRDYVPGEEEGAEAAESAATSEGNEAGGEDAEPTKPAPMPIAAADVESDGARLTALERMWGAGRFGPDACDPLVLDAMLEGMPADGDIGLMGADPAFVRMCADRGGRNVFASEWRSATLERARRAVPDVTVINDDVDRVKAFPAEALAALASVNTLGFADHKAGLVSSVFNALKDGGRWIVLDTVRTTAKTPPQAFASAWAEPQLSEVEEVEALLEKAGFSVVSNQNLTAQVIETARARMSELGAALETTVAEGMSGADGVLFLRELVWELKSWRARLRALEGGALQVVMWVATKGEVAAEAGPADAGGDAAAEPDLSEMLAEAVAAPQAMAGGGVAEETSPEPEAEAEEGPSDDEMTARIAAMVASASGSEEKSEDAQLDESLFDPPA